MIVKGALAPQYSTIEIVAFIGKNMLVFSSRGGLAGRSEAWF